MVGAGRRASNGSPGGNLDSPCRHSLFGHCLSNKNHAIWWDGEKNGALVLRARLVCNGFVRLWSEVL